MGPLAPIAPLIGTIVTAVTSVGMGVFQAVQANKQAKDAEARQKAYYEQQQAEQQAAEAKELKIKQDAAERSRAYGLSLLDSDTSLKNNLTGSYDDTFGAANSGSVLTSGLSSGLQDIFA